MVKEKNEVYKCSICGNIIEVTHVGGGTLVCCGKEMNKLEANTVEASQEKHLPVVEILTDKIVVKIGSVPHPMEEAHFIEWVELVCQDKIYRKYLTPGMDPIAEFCNVENVKAVREYCNLHGLWQTNL